MKLPAFHRQPLPHFSAKRVFTAGEVPGDSKGVHPAQFAFKEKCGKTQDIFDFITTASRNTHRGKHVKHVTFYFMFQL